MDGNQVVAPENNWVRDMEKEWAATGYDDRFFDDDWDDVKPGPKPPAKEKFPFKNISDDDWKETVTWEDEEADGTISRSDAAKARAQRAARTDPSSPSFTPPPDDPRVDPGPDFTPPVMDLNYDEEAAMLGFDAKAGDGGAEGDEAEPEGPPAVMLAGFRAEEIPTGTRAPRRARRARRPGHSCAAGIPHETLVRRVADPGARLGIAAGARFVQPRRRIRLAAMRDIQRLGPW